MPGPELDGHACPNPSFDFFIIQIMDGGGRTDERSPSVEACVLRFMSARVRVQSVKTARVQVRFGHTLMSEPFSVSAQLWPERTFFNRKYRSISIFKRKSSL